jgi:AraC-like DNA-binding protein
MKSSTPLSRLSIWRNEQLFDIDFISYRLHNHHFPRHFHDHYVIEMVTGGTDGFYCNGTNYIAETNELVCINPGEVHTGNTIGNTALSYYSLCPRKEKLSEIANLLHISLPPGFRFENTVSDRPLFAAGMKALFNSFHRPGNNLEQEELFVDCMKELLQPAVTTTEIRSSAKDPRVRQVKEYIHAHFKNDISLQQLSSLVSLNPYHLIRLFKRNTGLSPYDYLLVTRAEYGKQLLRKGYAVKDAAIESGFYDTSHFNRSFRKYAGVSPKFFLSSKGQYCTSIINQDELDL